MLRAIAGRVGRAQRRLNYRWAAAGTAAAIAGACGVAFAVADGGGGRYVPQLGFTVPADKVAAVERALPKAQPESNVPAPVPTTRISPVPAVMLDNRSVPLSPSLIRVANGWMVSDGRHLVAVYAGAAGDDASSGRIVIIRQDLQNGTQTEKVITLPGVGALTINSAPAGAAAETSAQTAALSYRSTSGEVGKLDLASDTVP